MGRRSIRRTTLLVLALVLLVVVRAWVVEPLRIASESMTPTLRPGDHVLVEKLTGSLGQWRRGDLVALTSPTDADLLVKRVVGLGGDRVAIRDGRLVVNGDRVREAYADPERMDSVYYGPVHVPDGEVLVMGDNRAGSVDSRDFGTVPEADIEARVVALLWPPSHARFLSDTWEQP